MIPETLLLTKIWSRIIPEYQVNNITLTVSLSSDFVNQSNIDLIAT